MTQEEYDALNKKIDKLTNLVTKVGKALHIFPVTEKEEREIQATQRKNAAIQLKVFDELEDDNPKGETGGLFNSVFNTADVFSDVLGDEYR